MPGANNRVAFASAKGGVGKTTISLNAAAALNRLGHDVLYVDGDPQGVATEGLGFLDDYDAEPPTIFDALLDDNARNVVNDLILEHDEMDVLPSNVDLLRAERELTVADLIAEIQSDPAADFDPMALAEYTSALNPNIIHNGESHARHQLDDVLDAIDHDYDVIVIDSPPYYGEILYNCLYAAPNVVVPALAEGTSQRAVELLFDQMAAMEDETGVFVDDVAAVANRVRASTNEAEQMLEWLEVVFDDIPFHEVRERVDLQYAFDAGVSIFEYNPDSDLTEVFLDLGRDIEEELNL